MQELADRFGLASLVPPVLSHSVFAAVALDFFINAFTRAKEWVRYHEIKQDILFEVADSIARHGTGIAFSTQTIHLKNTAETP